MIVRGTAKKSVGQMDYTRTATWDNRGRYLIAPLRKAADADHDYPVNLEMKFCLEAVMHFLEHDSEKKVSSLTLARQHGIFFGDARGSSKKADGSWAREGIGGVLFKAGKVWYFMIEVTAKWNDWLGPEGEQRINAAEGIPLLLLMQQPETREEIRGIDLTVYIDNSAAEWTLRRPPPSATGPGAIYLYGITAECWKEAQELELRLWINRVPSKLNPADPLSRMQDIVARKAGWKKIQVTLPNPATFWWVMKIMHQARAREAPKEKAKTKALPKERPQVAKFSRWQLMPKGTASKQPSKPGK